MPVRFHDLALGGQLMLWAARHWMKARARRFCMPVCVWRSFAAAGLEDAFVALCRVMASLATAPGDIRLSRPESCALNAWEVEFVRTMARMQDTACDRPNATDAELLIVCLNKAGYRVLDCSPYRRGPAYDPTPENVAVRDVDLH